jgi:L-ribulose-5-phosphate 4-epimerase
MDHYKTLREEAYEASLEIPKRHLAVHTWGNVSAFDPDKGVFAIKPTGVSYEMLKPESMVIVDLDGAIVDGKLKPSMDTETHRILYIEFSDPAAGEHIRGIVHTHSTYAVAWAQARYPVPVLGTTHADYSFEEIPCTEIPKPEAVTNNYELEIGNLIINTFKQDGKNPARMPMILVAGHGPYTWGNTAAEAIYHASVLEEICKIGFITFSLNSRADSLPDYIIRKHWERKHGTGSCR